MKAMILAAGRGERMKPLTDSCPKPLLNVHDKPLIVWHIERLKAHGIQDIVINTAWLGEQITHALGKGEQWGVTIEYSHEHYPGLETAGGIAQALPLLGQEPFLVINGDIWTDWPIQEAFKMRDDLKRHECLASLIFVNNPAHHPSGDYGIQDHRLCSKTPENAYTFSGIGVYQPEFFKKIAHYQPMIPYKLKPLFDQALANHQVMAHLYQGLWFDIGTPERLATLDHLLRSSHLSIDPSHHCIDPS
ncbi:N-acetylmuramate alpha-1-phosphate uridylyltransferase MurU [Basilea psittacipulmonis]|uniref:N-acetylmuramate alpha-1-phosphate uridylyltransferase MurU n=1 Tax=Basilea psittacipulmonis TaxID=1472345 RepID=UPI00068E0421|nr:nucleotidyltransferase family protein [Basilea psittacipulmonis]